MKKTWITVLMVMLLAIICFNTFAYAESMSDDAADELVIYVSPDGDDSGDGSPENMLKSPAGVQNYLRKSGVLRKKPVRVVFKPGDYFMESGLTFTKEDRGSEECPVVWEAETKGTVHILGSTVLDTSLFTPVTDEKIMAKLPVEARGKVLQMDLRANGVHIDAAMPHLWSQRTFVQPYTDLIRNGKVQMLSRWPNGINNYAKWDKVLVSGSTGKSLRGVEYGAKLEFKNPRISRWVGVENAWITGHVSTTYSTDFLEVHSVDPKAGTIQLMTASFYIPNDGSPKELQIFNLIEEMDIPTEWYIDAKTQTLYYYPAGDIKDEDVFELITLNEDMFTFQNDVDFHYYFNNLDISRCRMQVFRIEGNYVYIDGCTLMYSKSASPLWFGGNNLSVENCVIAHHDGRALGQRGEDEVTKSLRTPNIFKNNYIYDVGSMCTSLGHAVVLEGSGVDVIGNTMHYLPQGTTFGGATTCDWRVLNNEFYNYGLNLSDVGGFYIGYTGGAIGTEVAYNFFYDYYPANPNIGQAVQGVYYDDGACYGYVHHNIFANGAHGAVQIGGGKYNRAIGNIMLNMGVRPLETDHRVESWANGEQIAAQTHGYAATRLNKVSRFSKIYPWTNHLEESERRIPYGNVLTNNISDAVINIDYRMEEFGKIKDNYTISDYSHFVDPENYDFRLKDTSVFANIIPELTESKFDLSTVGCSLDVTENIDKSFKLLAPVNGMEYDSLHRSFVWENATMADKYRITIATDKEMKNVVFTDTVYYNYCDVDGLEDGKEYWWTVEALNTSFKRGSSWQALAPASFVNTLSAAEDVEDLQYYISNTERILETEDLSLYEDGAVDDFKAVISEVKSFQRAAGLRSDVTKAEVTAYLEKLNEAKDTFNKQEKIPYAKLEAEKLESVDNWFTNSVTSRTNGDGSITFTRDDSADANNNVHLKELHEADKVFTFRGKIDWLVDTGGGWASFEVCKTTHDKSLWNDTGVMVIVKPDIIELQVYPSLGMAKTIENKWVKSGEWHEYAIGVVSKADCHRIIFVIDGEVVFSHNDYTKKMPSSGYFGSLLSNVSLTLAPSEMDYGNVDASGSVILTNMSGYSENGTWAVCELKGESESQVRRSKDHGASATWKVEKIIGEKKIYFRKISFPDGDSKAKVTITSNYNPGREGDEITKEFIVDFSSGEDEWILLDAERFSEGDVTITISGSGSGAIYANAVRVE